MNAIAVHGDAVGPTLFYGAGAGEMPTASAVVADLMEIAREIRRGSAGAWRRSPTRPTHLRPKPMVSLGELYGRAATCASPRWTGRACSPTSRVRWASRESASSR